jgi:O-antigen/teichoic acid export membrane protein
LARREWLRQGLPFSINSGAQIGKSRLLTYIIAVCGSIEAVAVFDVAMRGAKLVSFTLDALNRAIAPFVSSAYERGQKENLQRIVKKTSRLVFLSSLPVALVIFIGGPPLLQWIFGDAYEAAYVPLVILCAGALVSALAGSVGLLLNMTGNQAVFTKSNVWALVINALASIPLVYLFEAIGAAIIYSLVLILQNIWLLHFTRKELRIDATAF